MDARCSEEANLLHLYAAEHVLKLSAELLRENIDENQENKEEKSGIILSQFFSSELRKNLVICSRKIYESFES